jgi:hypothetical protein|tara:strand:- start:613 stop:888 length:276 start_codon:yes stop_codon:yes gene_type:complete
MRSVVVGDLVNNVEGCDYNYGMVIETHINITDELLDWQHSAGMLCSDTLQESYRGVDVEPDGARVLWENGDINVHYFDELEVISEQPKQMV